MRTTLIFLCLAALGLLACYAGGSYITLAQPRHIGELPVDLPGAGFKLAYGRGDHVAGWRIRGEAGHGVVVILHGIRGDRSKMLPRARLLRSAGFSVVLIDLPAHGESSGDQITMGLRESPAIDAVLQYVAREFPLEHIGVLGISFGGACWLMGKQTGSAQAVMLESVFATLEEATTNRMRAYLGPMGPALTPLLLRQLPFRLGINAASVRPIDGVAGIKSPLLVVSGEADPFTPAAETRRLFDAATGQKELWLIPQARHVDLLAAAGKPYEDRMLAFFRQHLRKQGPG